MRAKWTGDLTVAAMPRPTGRPARVAIMAALLCVPVVATAVAAWYLPTVAGVAVMFAASAVAVFVVIKVVDPAGKGSVATMFCTIGASLAMLFAVPLLILLARGEHAVATVTSESIAYSRTSSSYEYRLVTASGRKIPGELSEDYDEFSAGDQVSVVFDPLGVADPHDEDFVGLGLPLAGGALALLVATVVLCVPATAAAGARTRG